MKLTIELVPETCWFKNVRSEVTKERWTELRNNCYNKAGHKCEICDSTGKKQGFNHNVECHEVWKYDDKNKIQRLEKLIALCPLCHKVKHVGLARVNGEEKLVLKHLMKVNNMTETDAIDYISDSFKLGVERSKYKWKLDISWLDNNDTILNTLLNNHKRFRSQ